MPKPATPMSKARSASCSTAAPPNSVPSTRPKNRHTIATMMQKSVYHQYSERVARPSNVAYFFERTVFTDSRKVISVLVFRV